MLRMMRVVQHACPDGTEVFVVGKWRAGAGGRVAPQSGGLAVGRAARFREAATAAAPPPSLDVGGGLADAGAEPPSEPSPGPPSLQLDGPPSLQLDGPPSLQLDGPPSLQLDGPATAGDADEAPYLELQYAEGASSQEVGTTLGDMMALGRGGDDDASADDVAEQALGGRTRRVDQAVVCRRPAGERRHVRPSGV